MLGRSRFTMSKTDVLSSRSSVNKVFRNTYGLLSMTVLLVHIVAYISFNAGWSALG